MTCKDCIHSGLCYKENDYENFPNRCGSFIPKRPQGVWIDNKEEPYYPNCSCCGYQIDIHENRGYFPFCPYCGADMRGKKNE